MLVVSLMSIADKQLEVMASLLVRTSRRVSGGSILERHVVVLSYLVLWTSAILVWCVRRMTRIPTLESALRSLSRRHVRQRSKSGTSVLDRKIVVKLVPSASGSVSGMPSASPCNQEDISRVKFTGPYERC